MKKNFFIVYGVVIGLLSLFALLITYCVSIFEFRTITTGSVTTLCKFCLDEMCWLISIKDLYFLGILSGGMIGFAMFLSYLVLDKKGIIGRICIYLRDMDNKVWKALLLGFVILFVYIVIQTLGFSLTILLNIDVFFVEYNINCILIEYLIILCMLLLNIKLIFFTKKRAFSIENLGDTNV